MPRKHADPSAGERESEDRAGLATEAMGRSDVGKTGEPAREHPRKDERRSR